jgi:hypothetical protein
MTQKTALATALPAPACPCLSRVSGSIGKYREASGSIGSCIVWF